MGSKNFATMQDLSLVTAGFPPDQLAGSAAHNNPDNTATLTYPTSLDSVFAGDLTPYIKQSLSLYNTASRYRLASGGVIVQSLSAIPFLTDPTTRNTVNSAYQYGQSNPGHITNWKMSDGTFIQLSVAQMTTLNNTMTTFVQTCFTKESTNLASINAGSMTTLAQIDAAYATISNVYP
jgi:hypothetical protein